MKCYITATELKEKLEAARCEEMKKQSKVTVTGMFISNMSGHDRRTGDNMQFQKVRDMWSPFGEKIVGKGKEKKTMSFTKQIIMKRDICLEHISNYVEYLLYKFFVLCLDLKI